jgi:hypothetical protein
MMDGSGYDSLTGISPLVYMAKRVDPAAPMDEAVRSPHVMMVGVDPDDPRPPWEIAAEQAGRMAVQRRQDRARYMAQAGHGFVAATAPAKRRDDKN